MKQPPVDDADVLRSILRAADTVLLDFDGPVCSVFSGLPARFVAAQLRDVLADTDPAPLPPDVEKTDDPFDVLRYAATLGNDEAIYVEAALRAHEVEAVATAEPTPGAHRLINKWRRVGKQLVIVSNNSATAIRVYLELHDLSDVAHLVSARTQADPTLLKPAPHLVTEAMTLAGALPHTCVLVGDSAADMVAARSAGVTPIGYANKMGKDEHLAQADAEALITTLAALDL